jgi:sec-independent protein translocase protein TatA
MKLLLFGISGGEIFLVLFIVLLLFGADKIPELVRSVGKGMNEFKKAADEIKRELSETANELKQDTMQLTREVESQITEAGNEMRTTTNFEPYEELSKQDDSVSEEEPQDDGPKPIKRQKGGIAST